MGQVIGHTGAESSEGLVILKANGKELIHG